MCFWGGLSLKLVQRTGAGHHSSAFSITLDKLLIVFLDTSFIFTVFFTGIANIPRSPTLLSTIDNYINKFIGLIGSFIVNSLGFF
jgi:hypothetical protein